MLNTWANILKPLDHKEQLEPVWRELSSVSPSFFREENNLFSFLNDKTKSNILMELAKSAKDDALRELLVNRNTYRCVV